MQALASNPALRPDLASAMRPTPCVAVRPVCPANPPLSRADARRDERLGLVRVTQHSTPLSAKPCAAGSSHSTRVGTRPGSNLHAGCNAIDRAQLARSPGLRKRTASASGTMGRYLQFRAAQPTSDPANLDLAALAENPKECVRRRRAIDNEQSPLLTHLKTRRQTAAIASRHEFPGCK